MPEYPFRTPDGTITHRLYAMKDAPSIGDTVTIDGQPCVRVASDCLVNSDPVSKRYPVESVSLPRNIPECKRRSPRGRPIIENAAHHKRICEVYGLVKE